jgi:hypothetical protein
VIDRTYSPKFLNKFNNLAVWLAKERALAWRFSRSESEGERWDNDVLDARRWGLGRSVREDSHAIKGALGEESLVLFRVAIMFLLEFAGTMA